MPLQLVDAPRFTVLAAVTVLSHTATSAEVGVALPTHDVPRFKLSMLSALVTVAAETLTAAQNTQLAASSRYWSARISKWLNCLRTELKQVIKLLQWLNGVVHRSLGQDYQRTARLKSP